jgi:PAS domain S-box-containing protein
MAEDQNQLLSEVEKNSLCYAVFRQALIGMGLADMDGNLIDFNDAVLKPGGYSREEIFQLKNVANLYYLPEERARALSLAKKQGHFNRFPCLFKRKDGTAYQTLLTLRLLTHENKKYWLATVEDLSGGA